MSWFGCNYLRCGDSSNITPYETVSKETEEIISSIIIFVISKLTILDSCNSKNMIYIDSFIKILSAYGVNQSDAEDLFSSLITPNAYSLPEKFILPSQPENAAKLKKLLATGKSFLEEYHSKESALDLQIRKIINSADEKGIIYEKRLVSALQEAGLVKDKAEMVWSVIPTSAHYHFVSKINVIDYFSSKEREDWLLTMIKQSKEQKTISPNHFFGSSFNPQSTNRGPPAAIRALSVRPGHSYSISSINESKDKQQIYLKDQLFRSLCGNGSNQVITTALWQQFPWAAANISPEIALNIFANIPKASSDVVTKDEFDTFFLMNYDKLSPLLLKGYKAIQHQKVMLIRKQSLSGMDSPMTPPSATSRQNTPQTGGLASIQTPIQQ